MRILLSNDDGVHAPGLKAMYDELKKLGQVCVVAPLEEKSTTGHSLTLHKPLRLIPMGKDFYGVNGSPADCVYIGIRQVLKQMPDLVVSGINRGANLGQDVYYSGTVSAAREACILGLPSIAVSLAVNFAKARSEDDIHYSTAAKVAVQFLRDFDRKSLPIHTLLNLNVPDVPFKAVKGIEVARQGFRYYSGTVLKRRDHRGKDYFWVGGQYKGFKKSEGTDVTIVDRGFASLTPLKLDGTDDRFLKTLTDQIGGNRKR
ncbi:MAG: 5'/3'-nucleotidase SurE [Bdellovibrionales bacterium]|nr:5'/3'-nucleotidase SurE [Bdellovibrionales bacterium]